MQVSVHEGDETITVKVTGQITHERSAELREKILGLADSPAKNVILDIAEMPYIDTSGLGVLVGARTHLKKRGVDFRIINAQEKVKKVFHLTRLAKLFGVD